MDVLLVDDDELVRTTIAEALLGAGHRVTEACDGLEAVRLLGTRAFDLAVCDVKMPRLDGLALFRKIRADAPRTDVVPMTSFGRIPDAIGALRDGAADYVTKPFDPDDFAERVVGGILRRRELGRRLEESRQRKAPVRPDGALVGMSPAMRRLGKEITEVARRDVTVMIAGTSARERSASPNESTRRAREAKARSSSSLAPPSASAAKRRSTPPTEGRSSSTAPTPSATTRRRT